MDVFSTKSISINGEIFENIGPENIDKLLNQCKEIEYKEISINGCNDTALIIEMNKNKSICIYLESVDKWISYHSLNENGKKNVYEEFILSDGQKDEYEDIFLIENEKINKVIKQYLTNGTRTEHILWEKD